MCLNTDGYCFSLNTVFRDGTFIVPLTKAQFSLSLGP